MIRGSLLLVVLLAFIAGCPPPADVAPATRREALERVNDNLLRISEPLQCAALVTFKFQDANGKERSFIGHEARLIYTQPQSLLFDVRALTGTVARFGSNDQQYWVWIDVPDLRKLWWGDWLHTSEGALRRLPVPPNELLDALMLRPLTESLEGELLPLLRIEGDDHRLVFVRLGIDRQPTGVREIRLDPHAPYQPREIVDRLPDGEIAMHAVLDNYQRVGADGPFTARRYVVTWPQNKAEMRLDILRAVFRPRADLGDDLFALPADWQGDSERIDAPAEQEPGRQGQVDPAIRSGQTSEPNEAATNAGPTRSLPSSEGSM